jgi:hypothetical protein
MLFGAFISKTGAKIREVLFHAKNKHPLQRPNGRVFQVPLDVDFDCPISAWLETLIKIKPKYPELQTKVCAVVRRGDPAGTCFVCVVLVL